MENMGIKLFAFGVSALDIFSSLSFFLSFLFLRVAVGFPFVFWTRIMCSHSTNTISEETNVEEHDDV